MTKRRSCNGSLAGFVVFGVTIHLPKIIKPGAARIFFTQSIAVIIA
jgi:hypothetical protein